jgi:hypothetical protein
VVANDVCGEDAGRFYVRGAGVSGGAASTRSLSPTVPRLRTAV